MKKFCSKCGAELGQGKFCKMCGAPVASAPVPPVGSQSSSPVAPHTDSTTGSSAGMNALPQSQPASGAIYAAMMIFPILYIILILCPWFKITIPFIGSSTFHIYDLLGGFNKLFEYTESGGATEFIAKAFAVVLIIEALSILYYCIRSFISALQKKSETMAHVANASSAAIAEAVLVIIAVWIFKAALNSELEESGLGFFSSAVSDIISFTAAPVITLIVSIIGRIAASLFHS